MATEKSKLDPALTEKIKQAAAAANEEVLSRTTLETLLHVSPEDLIERNPDREVIKGTAYHSGGWQHAPAQWELFAAADKRLTRVANWAGLNTKRVERVHARLVKGTKLLIIQAASPDDLTAFPVIRYGGSSSIWINLIELLSETGLTVETGYRERYDVAYVPKGSPLWPGLVIDLSQSQERRMESGFKRKKGQGKVGKTAAAAGENRADPQKDSKPAAALEQQEPV